MFTVLFLLASGFSAISFSEAFSKEEIAQMDRETREKVLLAEIDFLKSRHRIITGSLTYKERHASCNTDSSEESRKISNEFNNLFHVWGKPFLKEEKRLINVYLNTDDANKNKAILAYDNEEKEIKAKYKRLGSELSLANSCGELSDEAFNEKMLELNNEIETRRQINEIMQPKRVAQQQKEASEKRFSNVRDLWVKRTNPLNEERALTVATPRLKGLLDLWKSPTLADLLGTKALTLILQNEQNEIEEAQAHIRSLWVTHN